MKERRKQLLWVAFTLLVAAVITWFSCQPGDESAGSSWALARRIRPVLRLDDTASVLYFINFVLRKLAHFALFAALGFGLYGSLRSFRRRRVPPFRSAVILGAACGALDEFHQSFVPGRVAMLTDVLLDACGVLFGVAAGWFLLRYLERRKNS